MLAFGCMDFQWVPQEKEMIAPEVEVFEYSPGLESATILMVVDSSSSMNSDWGHVLHEVPLISQALLNLDRDWELGIASADDRFPELVDTISSGEAVDLSIGIGTLRNNLALHNETPLAGAMNAYAANPSLFEDAQAVHFLLLSDEDDQSTVSADQWIDWTDTLGSRYESVTTTTIGGTQQSFLCGNTNALKLQQASDQFLDICPLSGADWSTAIAPLIGAVTSKNEDMVFPLEGTPAPSTIRVWVGDNETDLWEYLPDTNSVEVQVTPEYRMSVVVSYYE